MAAPECGPTSPPPKPRWPTSRARRQGWPGRAADITGQAPQFFRPTAGLRNPLLDPVLASLDLRLASWTRRSYDTRTGDVRRVLGRLTAGLGPGDILLMHDGNGALTPAGEPVILAALPHLVNAFAEAGLSPVTLTAAVQ